MMTFLYALHTGNGRFIAAICLCCEYLPGVAMLPGVDTANYPYSVCFFQSSVNTILQSCFKSN